MRNRFLSIRILAPSLALFASAAAGAGACGGGETVNSLATASSSGGGSSHSTGDTATSSSTASATSSATGTGGASTSSATSTGTSTGTGGGTGTSTGAGGSPPVIEYDCNPPIGNAPMLKLTEIANGITRPVLVRSVPGDDTRLYVLGQDGKIWIIKNGALLPTPFLDISAIVHKPSGGDERGLLGFAFHPKYPQNGRFFVYYTDNNNQNGSTGDQHLAEYARSLGDPDAANPTVVADLFTQFDSQPNHNGGGMEFSPLDGYLYLGMGDGGGAGDKDGNNVPQHAPEGNGQSLGTRWGKIIRLDVDSPVKPYGIPPGNMPGMGVTQEIWDYGLRNAWRFSFDLCTNNLYIGDVGQDKYEEIDVEPAGQGNKNYGWRVTEGLHCYPPMNPDTCNKTGITMPVVEYPHGAECSVSGGYVYRSSAIPALRGAYFYGDYCSGKIWTITYNGGMASAPVLHPEITPGANVLVSFGQDNLGNVYVTALNGKVYRIDSQ
jgi:glucose/arabinose dehydrogenase